MAKAESKNMNEKLIQQLTDAATELRARPDMNYWEGQAATALLNAAELLGLADARRRTDAPATDAPAN